MTPLETVACPACDLLQRIPPLPYGGKASCPRCGQTLAARPPDPLNRPLALTIAAALVFLVANTSPLMGLSAVGRQASTTIIGGTLEMWAQEREGTAVIVAFCVIIAPATYILFMLTVLLAARRPPAPHWVAELLRWAEFMRPWSMNEVMMLGILVALIKIAELATVIPGIGMYAVGVLILLLPAIMVTFDPGEIWKRVEWADGSFGGGATR
jgi:paraquat-inducible protein A